MNITLRTLGLLLAVIATLPVARALEWEATTIKARAKPGAEVVLVTYTFANPRATTVRILGIQTSCGCTEATPSESDIPAHGSGNIQVVFTVGKRTGTQEKEIRVMTDEDAKPVTLHLTVEIPAAASAGK